MPKYHWGKVERIGGKFLDTLEREFECKGTRYKIKIAPARITDKDGIDREYFPSKREELVEDALRRFATTQQGVKICRFDYGRFQKKPKYIVTRIK